MQNKTQSGASVLLVNRNISNYAQKIEKSDTLTLAKEILMMTLKLFRLIFEIEIAIDYEINPINIQNQPLPSTRTRSSTSFGLLGAVAI